MSVTSPANVEIGEAVIFQALEDEVVLLNMTSQKYYGLDDVGATMWNLLLEHHDVEKVVTKLQDIYDADESLLRQDLATLVQKLVEVDLLKQHKASGE